MRRQRGFTLIELLIVVAIIGIIAAIAIPNLLNAINRGRQKRTMADMRTIGTACEEYAVDFGFYPMVNDFNSLVGHLEPTYVQHVPRTDGWNQPFVFTGDTSAGRHYTIRSYARNRTADALHPTTPQTSNFDEDIAFSDGHFVQWPEGVQTD